MARKVFISSDMSIDEQLAEVAEQDSLAALLWPWLLTTFDDWGRAEAHPRRLKAKVFPMNDMVTVEVIENALRLYEKVGLLVLYEVDGKPYMAIPEDKWYKYQTHMNRSRRPGKDKMDSDLPAPPSGNRGESKGPHGEIKNPHGAPRGSEGVSGGSSEPHGAPQFPLPSPSPSPTNTTTTTTTTAHAREGEGEHIEGRVAYDEQYHPKRTDDRLARVAQAYEGEIGVLTSAIQQALIEAVDKYPEDWITDAIREAAINNVRKWSYVQRILETWQREGRGTVVEPKGRRVRPKTRDKPAEEGVKTRGAPVRRDSEDVDWDELERAFYGQG